jgi:hypothetical protein
MRGGNEKHIPMQGLPALVSGKRAFVSNDVHPTQSAACMICITTSLLFHESYKYILIRIHSVQMEETDEECCVERSTYWQRNEI